MVWSPFDLSLYPVPPSLVKRRSMEMTSPYNSGLYASLPVLRILTMILEELILVKATILWYFSPSLMRFLRLVPRFVAFAFPPRQTVKAVRMADFPDPL